MEIVSRISELLQPFLDGGKFYVVDLSLTSSSRMPKLTLLVDSDAGISIDECASISRRLGHAIETEELFETAYNLEVSSPGIDTPLTSLRQYQKNLGRTIKFTLADGTKILGKLIKAEGDTLEIQEEVLKGKLKTLKTENTILALDQIKLAQVQVSFS